MVIPGHNLGNSQVSINRTIGPTLVLKLAMEHRGLRVYKVYVCINDDSWLTLTNLTAMSKAKFVLLCLWKISGKCLQDHWSSG